MCSYQHTSCQVIFASLLFTGRRNNQVFHLYVQPLLTTLNKMQRRMCGYVYIVYLCLCISKKQISQKERRYHAEIKNQNQTETKKREMRMCMVRGGSMPRFVEMKCGRLKGKYMNIPGTGQSAYPPPDIIMCTYETWKHK